MLFRQKSNSIATQGQPNSIAVHSHTPNRKHSWASTVVTASSYDALGMSPALSFLAQFAAPMSPRVVDDEGDQVGGYILGKIVGRGGFSTVREAHTVDPVSGELGRKVACKVIENEGRDRVEKEVAIWKGLSHVGIVEFLGIEESGGTLYIFSEFCEGGDLLHQLTSGKGGKLTEERAREKFLQIAEAVRYLHEDVRVCHKDLKLENVLIDANGRVKLADFGLAEWMDIETEQMNLPPRSPLADEPSSPQPLDVQEEIAGGSLAYASPEQLRTSKVLRCPATDIWSLGVILYAFVTGSLPFMDEYEPRMQYKILSCQYEVPRDISEECKELIKGCFKTKAAERLDIRAVLESDWCTM